MKFAKNVYVQAGISDANPDPTAPFEGFESVFDEGDFLKDEDSLQVFRLRLRLAL